jgi:hypothetical protein
MFVVLGVATMLLYAVMAAWMTIVGRRDPGRVFHIGRYGRIRRRDVTAAEWIRRYVPWGLGSGLLVTLLGLVLVAQSH